MEGNGVFKVILRPSILKGREPLPPMDTRKAHDLECAYVENAMCAELKAMSKPIAIDLYVLFVELSTDTITIKKTKNKTHPNRLRSSAPDIIISHVHLSDT